jgi:hypothetical protein
MFNGEELPRWRRGLRENQACKTAFLSSTFLYATVFRPVFQGKRKEVKGNADMERGYPS